MPAGMEGMALENSDDCPENTGDRSAIPDRFDRVLAAGRSEPAARRKKRADSSLVDPNQPYEQLGEDSQRQPPSRYAATSVALRGNLYGATQQPLWRYAWNELPQPQVFTAFGFSNVNPCFSRLSYQSTVVPSR